MSSKKLLGVFLSSWLSMQSFYGQQNEMNTETSTLSSQISEPIAVDSLPQSNKPMLLDKVKYKAKELMRIDKKNNTLLLYDEAECIIRISSLKQEYCFDYAKQEVYAGRIPDTTGTLTQYPFFKQANNEVNPDWIRFNFETKKA